MDLTEARTQRDRNLALRFVELQESETAIRQIHEETGVNLRTVRRAVYRQLAWAKLKPQIEKGPGSDTLAP
jgi:hypothetical protein